MTLVLGVPTLVIGLPISHVFNLIGMYTKTLDP